MQLKKHETGRSSSSPKRNSKGKAATARLRQLAKRNKLVSKKLQL